MTRMLRMKKTLRYSENFRKQFQKCPAKIKKSTINRINLFNTYHHHPLVRNHKLSGKYQGYRSINITGDWRALYREDKANNTIIFELIGTHSQLYNWADA